MIGDRQIIPDREAITSSASLSPVIRTFSLTIQKKPQQT
jgi:hypothetical protein